MRVVNHHLTAPHSPAPSLLVGGGPDRLNRTSDTTAPPFWARPVWSSDRVCQPAMSPAVARTCDTVTTPVPPTPVSRIPNEPGSTTGRGAGSSSGVIASAAGRRPAGAPGTTVMNAGQSPSRQL